jgi:hypothetical protein
MAAQGMLAGEVGGTRLLAFWGLSGKRDASLSLGEREPGRRWGEVGPVLQPLP